MARQTPLPQPTLAERLRCPLTLTVTALLLLTGLAPAHAASGPASSFSVERLDNPARTVVLDVSGSWLATLTDGAFTVTLAGPHRTIAEPTTSASVDLAAAVRLLPLPFGGEVDPAWLERALADPRPDLLAVALQYLAGAPPLYDDNGRQVAGAAAYGPLLPDGSRQEGADFYDYLQLPWTVAGQLHQPAAAQALSLDCSGYVRMVFGYRGGLPLGLAPDGQAIPRRAYQILDAAPGAVTIPNHGGRVEDFSLLAAGDLVFFDADPSDGPQIDHVGIYLGPDSEGHQRFLSSRKRNNGPTLGDLGGRSILDGSGLYASAFRAARRL